MNTLNWFYLKNTLANTKLSTNFCEDCKILLTGDQTNGSFSIIEQSYCKDIIVPEHSHTKEDHFVEIICGSFDFYIESQKISLSEGNVIFIPKFIWHYFIPKLEINILRITIFPSGLEKLMELSKNITNKEELDTLMKMYGINFR